MSRSSCDQQVGGEGNQVFGEDMKHPRKLTWNPKNGGLEDDFPFQQAVFRFHVGFLRILC